MRLEFDSPYSHSDMSVFSITRLPVLLVGLGLGFFLLGIAVKNELPHAIGLLPVIQFPCAFFSAVLIPFGSLLAFRALILQTGARRNLVSCHLSGLVFVFITLSLYFWQSIAINRVIEIAQFPNVLPQLPQLVKNARSLPDEQKRRAQAEVAYDLYGAIIAYRLDNEQAVFYEPDATEVKAWHESERVNRQIYTKLAFIKKMLTQFPYLFGLYAATFTTTFIVGWIWLMVRLPKDLPEAVS